MRLSFLIFTEIVKLNTRKMFGYLQIATLNTRKMFGYLQIVTLNTRKMYFFRIAKLSTRNI